MLDLAMPHWRCRRPKQRLSLPGSASNFASTPDHASLDITGDILIRVMLSLTDWTPAAGNQLVSKYNAAGTRAYTFSVQTGGVLRFTTSADGTSIITRDSTAMPTVSDGGRLGVAVALDVNNGAAGNTATFYVSSDFLTWTQLGDPVVNASTTSIFANSEPLEIGVFGGTTNPTSGKIHRAQVFNGIVDGTLVADFDPSLAAAGALSFSDRTGKLWTVNQSGGTPAVIERVRA